MSSQFFFLAYFNSSSSKKWKPNVCGNDKVKIVDSQYGTDDNGKTYYYDAVLEALNQTDVEIWIKNQNNFSYLSYEVEKIE